jgi:VanZ family protein
MRLLLRHPWFWLGLGWALVVSVIVVSLIPGQKLPQVGISDKVEHALAYAMMTLWFTGMYPRSSYLRVALGMFALGVAIEIAQALLPFGREMDVRDVIANTVGIAIGIAAALAGLGGWAQRIENLAERLQNKVRE